MRYAHDASTHIVDSVMHQLPGKMSVTDPGGTHAPIRSTPPEPGVPAVGGGAAGSLPSALRTLSDTICQCMPAVTYGPTNLNSAVCPFENFASIRSFTYVSDLVWVLASNSSYHWKLAVIKPCHQPVPEGPVTLIIVVM